MGTASCGCFVVVGEGVRGGVRGGHGHHHHRLPRRQGDAATGHHRPTRACPGQPGHPQGAWWVGMGRGGPWRAVRGDRRCSQGGSRWPPRWGVATAVVRAKPTRTLHTGGRLPVRDFFGVGSAQNLRVGFARHRGGHPHRGGHRDPPWEHRRSPPTAHHGPPGPSLPITHPEGALAGLGTHGSAGSGRWQRHLVAGV